MIIYLIKNYLSSKSGAFFYRLMRSSFRSKKLHLLKNNPAMRFHFLLLPKFGQPQMGRNSLFEPLVVGGHQQAGPVVGGLL